MTDTLVRTGPDTSRTAQRSGSDPSDSEEAISVRELSVTYSPRSGPVTALSDVSFRIPNRQFVSLLGPSGCGKSTLLQVIAGLIPASSGRVLVSGMPVRGPVTDLGIVFQQDVLLPWRTALGNVMIQAEIRRLPRAAFKARALELLRSVGLAGFENKLPRELSGGMRQRVSIVRALAHDPPLLLMDEPFGALDAITRDQMNLDLLRIWSESMKTVLFVTHSIEEAVFLSDRVLVMDTRPGRITADVEIHLARPRALRLHDSPEFREYTRQIRHLFESMGFLNDSGQIETDA